MLNSALRRRLALALVALTAVLGAVTTISGYGRVELVDSGEFSRRATSALDDPRVREVVADRIVAALSANLAPDVLVARPLVVRAVAAVADSNRFRRLVERTLQRRHDALFNGDRAFTLRLLAGGGELLESLRSLSPRVAEAVPAGLTAPVIALHPRDFERRVAGWLATLAAWWWPLLAATLLAAAACAWLAGSLRAAVLELGLALAGAGLLVAIAVTGFGSFTSSHVSHALGIADATERAAIGALWDALFGDLARLGLLMLAGGLVVALLASNQVTQERLELARGRLLRGVREPSPTARVAQAAAFALLGVALILAPLTVLRGVGIALGIVLLLVAFARLSARLAPDDARKARPLVASERVLLGTVVATVALVTGAAAIVLPAPRATPPPTPPAGACNGSVELCDKRLNEVVLAATHNSYAAADEPGWYFPNQRHGIARQLRDGIRGFLIDIHYGVREPGSEVVRTDLRYEGSSRNKVARQLGPEALAAADRVAGRIGANGVGDLPGTRGVYLCHTLCELGAEPLDEQLDVIHRYLVDHPRTLLVLFVEPYVPVEAVERAFERADLLRYTARLRRDRPLPTLRQLIRSDQRLVVLAEEDGGTRPWYLDGFAFVQDTPLGATSARQFSCGRYRGSPDGPLFLVNHWIDHFPPSPRRNQRAGGRVLRQRLLRCERQRQLVPNLVAVDFYERTGVIEIADQLNRRR